MIYTDLNQILSLNISDSLKSEFKNKYNKRVYFKNGDNCQIGILTGYAFPSYYIIDNSKYIPITHSLTLV